MENFLHKLEPGDSETKNEYKPAFFRLPADVQKLENLFKQDEQISVFDQLQGQLEELVKLRNPQVKFTRGQLAEQARAHLGKIPAREYGVWVYYPWSRRLVHILDEAEFVEVRTSRNQYKITPAEEEILSKKKIGVVGLSVGQSVSVTMAMERIFGEIRLADFDILELSNYNRIRTGLHNLGLSKVISVAREMAEIDPYLRITCFTEGINENNIDEFFTKGGKLDILMEECDGLNIKILCRQKARELGIPVVMETSDRGMVDVERFDLEPNRPLLHGLIDHLDINKLKEAKTNEEKIPFILPMVGIDKISTRLKASMMEVEQTITTWPQLASAVAIGGGLATDVCRRIALNQFQESGRYYVDVEEIIGTKQAAGPAPVDPYANIHPPAQDYLEQVTERLLADSEILHEPSVDVVKELLSAAVQAPSGGNCQPWKWVYKKGLLVLFFDNSRNKSFLDYNDYACYIALGAAYENLVLKAHEKGLEISSTFFPITGQDNVVASIRFYEGGLQTQHTELHEYDKLAAFIFSRCTNRNIGEKKNIPAGVLAEMINMANAAASCTLQIAEKDEQLKVLAEIAGAGDRIRFLHPQSHYDLYHNEVRWNKEENESTRDGVDIATIPFTQSELTAFKLASDEKALSYLRNWQAGRAFEKISKKSVESASAVGFLTRKSYTFASALEGGRVMQRIWLWAQGQGLSIHPIMVPVMFFARMTKGNGAGLPEEMQNELRTLRKKFLGVFNSNNDTCEVFLFKIFTGEEPAVKSLRRGVDEVTLFI